MAQEPSTSHVWWRRAIRVGLLSFFLAVLVSYASEATLAKVSVFVAAIVLLLLISVNVAFDVLGTAVTAAEQVPLHAMASKRVHGSKQAIWLVRNADRVANFANDVVGDVSGAVTGAAGTSVALRLTQILKGGPLSTQLTGLAIVGTIAMLTVGGKSAGKRFAMDRATDVVMVAGRLIYLMEKATGQTFTRGRGANSSRRRTT